MTTAPTPTSGAAIQRYKIGYHPDEWGHRSSTPSGIPDASGSWVRYEDHVNALAAGQATAAHVQPAGQQGAAYAELPTSSYAGRVYEEGFLVGTFPLYTADLLHAFADATHALRASHWQAPAGAGEAAEHYRNAIARARLLDSDLSNLTERGAKAWAGVDAQGLRDGGASPSANAGEPSAHIKEPYTLAEIKAKIASNDYSAEMLLQHAMLLLDSVQDDAAREAIEKVLALFPFNAPIQKFTVNNGPCLTADNDDEFYSVKRVLAFLTEIKTTLDAARKQGEKQ